MCLINVSNMSNSYRVLLQDQPGEFCNSLRGSRDDDFYAILYMRRNLNDLSISFKITIISK